MGHDSIINVMRNLFFISSYGIDMDVIHLLVLFEHRCHLHCLNMNVICLFILFRNECCMSICVVYTRKSRTWIPCLNNAWHSCLNNTTYEIINFTQIWNEPMKHLNLSCMWCPCHPLPSSWHPLTFSQRFFNIP